MHSYLLIYIYIYMSPAQLIVLLREPLEVLAAEAYSYVMLKVLSPHYQCVLHYVMYRYVYVCVYVYVYIYIYIYICVCPH